VTSRRQSLRPATIIKATVILTLCRPLNAAGTVT
jgi:hypothetical protein